MSLWLIHHAITLNCMVLTKWYHATCISGLPINMLSHSARWFWPKSYFSVKFGTGLHYFFQVLVLHYVVLERYPLLFHFFVLLSFQVESELRHSSDLFAETRRLILTGTFKHNTLSAFSSQNVSGLSKEKSYSIMIAYSLRMAVHNSRERSLPGLKSISAWMSCARWEQHLRSWTQSQELIIISERE